MIAWNNHNYNIDKLKLTSARRHIATFQTLSACNHSSWSYLQSLIVSDVSSSEVQNHRCRLLLFSIPQLNHYIHLPSWVRWEMRWWISGDLEVTSLIWSHAGTGLSCKSGVLTFWEQHHSRPTGLVENVRNIFVLCVLMDVWLNSWIFKVPARVFWSRCGH